LLFDKVKNSKLGQNSPKPIPKKKGNTEANQQHQNRCQSERFFMLGEFYWVQVGSEKGAPYVADV